MNIGEASERSGLPRKTIRYYEDIDLVKPDRAENGYRDYGEEDVHRLGFLRRARSLGFSIEECRMLLSLYEDKGRSSADVKAIATQKIEEIQSRINEMRGLVDTLQHLADRCHGDDRPNCPIINDIAGKH